ncbi:Ppx/GppA phosphatase [Pseudopedobacter saltans DSM 12145]|uniref:Ppx/GppA phosphatase n=1 Tax=Pseudopedobacter saltans (strain ATCC 51119 / DSM 12145 / JCM 21818 / CCUG 39354 / LMG 10337 / NBRC 100064 / NCIMB 13643) TaxID=762903 RepID=F0S7N4_PSESL|nr:Ppx/GppA phosphatase [Pseudopedobacter saltans]ADY52294.1 Ppx/GppA phosphatase [Pseudopedobacter saltans DSM 12145]
MKAVIDIGTNTFHLLIGEVKNGRSEILFRQTIPVKLGEGGGISRGEIIPAAYQRGLDALKIFKDRIDEFKVKQIKATATAAVRDAKNGVDFINDVYKQNQIKIDVINGQQEAEYIYKGAKAAQILSREKALIIDIGGGSTELIIADHRQIFWKESYRIGAARLLSDFHKSDPISSLDIFNLNKHLQEVLKIFLEVYQEYRPTVLIGTAGSFDSFKEMFLFDETNQASELINYEFQNHQFLDLLEKIIKSTHEERCHMQGLIPLRVDMILMSSLLVKFILAETEIKRIISCTYSLKEGLLFSED